ncbi:sulfide/dihydroorotate dehydrogenase-like FAD/NAD-binding protein [Chitinivibrio alkaliphilus]|uniref:Glutamate synthase, small subunit n=1 Tax=Chitinivibrio alkaliphilus ACht1 TaxID=1313304 RepID=U7DBV6_9BACT|nr:sulfide/dihydroorotate dehydrogenase-like FAD/NAD-binding protein [Chitinivibrio alkaliphilus]ERP31890.1 glutamate synthase, small subunit [Chitinivibrio alkaliphilus ACht1]
MAEILQISNLSEHIYRVRLVAPRIAKRRKAGQFVIVRVTPDGERIPLTIANASAEEGWIELIIQAVGESTRVLRDMQVGDHLEDLAGPLGRATKVEKVGRVLCIGGGVGIAPLRPIAEAFKAAGNHVTTILGARTSDLIILRDDMDQISDELYIATDDGSAGEKGFPTDIFARLLDTGNTYDEAVVVGPPVMMKFTSLKTLDAGVPTMCSLNPIMIDGTGMCGGCRVTVAGEPRFACVDGPEFDAASVEWDDLLNRLSGYDKIAERNHTCRIGTDEK